MIQGGLPGNPGGLFYCMRTVFHSHRSAKYITWLFVTFTAIVIGVFCLLAQRNLQTASAQWAITDPRQTVQATASAAVLNCTPLAPATPYQLSLSSASAGLHTQTGAATQYQVYGNTASELRDQIQRCAPGANGSTSAEFTGQTEYSLGWQYTIAANDTGCTLTDVKVSLYTAVILPYWQTPNAAATGLAGRWQAFMTGLTTHEQGHVALDTTYANRILDSLNSLGTQSCDTIDASAKAVAANGATALEQANDSYDTATNHGATQGAVLPTY